MKSNTEISNKQKQFVAEYLKDKNATQAAIRSGYSAKTADVQGSRMLTNVKVKAAIEEMMDAAKQKAIVDEAWVLSRLKRVVEKSMQDEKVMEFDHDAKEMVHQKILIDDPENPGKMKFVGVYEFDSAGANGALRLLGQHLKMYTEKKEISGTLEKQEKTAIDAELDKMSKADLLKLVDAVSKILRPNDRNKDA